MSIFSNIRNLVIPFFFPTFPTTCKPNKLLQFCLNPSSSNSTIVVHVLLSNFTVSVALSSSMNRPCSWPAFSFLYSFYTLSTLLSWKFHSLPYNYQSYLEVFFLLQVCISNSDLSSRLLTLISHHLTSPPGLDPKPKA